jgi:formate dehydrogenase subunit gamma
MKKMIEKTTFGERFNHWVMLISFFVLTLTGFGFLYNSLNWLNGIFGGNHMAAAIHEWGGLVFAASLLFSLGTYLGESLSFGPQDSDWLKKKGGYFSKHVAVEPQGKLNAGQKLFYISLIIVGGTIVASGVILWVAGGSRGWMLIGHFLHNLAFVALMVIVPLHVYLATAANPGTFRIMTRGDVPVDWAKKHHGKWVKDLGLD